MLERNRMVTKSTTESAQRTYSHAIDDTVGGTTIQRLLKTIRKGGVLGSVLGQPEGADKYDIHVEAVHGAAGRLTTLSTG
jgi:hypothetical protein